MMTSGASGASMLGACSSNVLELFQLVVDRNAERLKRAGRGIDSPHAGRPYRAHHRAPQIERRLEFTRMERLLDAARDPPRAALIAVLVDDVGELVAIEPLDELERGLSVDVAHTHVERPLGAKAHSARRVVELWRADPEIGHDAVDPL